MQVQISKKVLKSESFKRFLKFNKKKRGLSFILGKVSREEVVALRYATKASASRSIMAIDHEYLLEKPFNPLLKWPGGKKSELKLLRQNFADIFPKSIRNYYEPFLGGGAVWLAMSEGHKSFVNDFSKDLIDFYSLIKNQDKKYFEYMRRMESVWILLKNISNEYAEKFYNGDLAGLHFFEDEIKKLSFNKQNAFPIILKILKSKTSRIYNLENKRGKLNKKDRFDNIEGALKAGYYTYIRTIYNCEQKDKALRGAAFFFLRDYCFSSMFRFNDKGEFNVPYGGISYNSRSPISKIQYLKNKDLFNHMSRTELNNLDFEIFLDKYKPAKEDWIFIDPPYDTEFSTYDKNEFGKEDQKRLAEFLINNTDAQFMAVMKNTDFIFDLYKDHEDKNIRHLTFDKNYTVSFKNRNDQDVEHIVVYRSY